MPENPTSMPEPSGENTAEVVAGKNDANVPETPAEPLGGVFVYPGDDDLAGIPVPPIASPGGRPVYPGDDDLAGIPTTPVAPSGGRPVYPDNTIGRPGFPTISFPVTYPTVSGGNYYSRVRFLNASTSGRTLDVYIDGRNIFSGSEFATISSYIRVTDGFVQLIVGGVEVCQHHGFGGLLLVQATKLYPLVMIYMNGMFSNLDNSLMEASANLGCSGVKRFLSVILRLSMPTILAAALLVFMRAFADFGTPLLIGEGYRTFTVEIYKQFLSETGSDYGFAAAYGSWQEFSLPMP